MHSDFERARDEYLISCDTSKLDLAVVHDFLSTSYWSLGLPHEVMHRAIEEALCFGLYRGDFQVGFARVITDKATFAYLCDVFVLEAYRGKGLG
jgi:GNAT superfamily N-acetyltransferase